MSLDHDQPSPRPSGVAADIQAGRVALRSRTSVPFMAAVGAMVIGILLAVTAIVGVARDRR